jgi:hypothetical protein
MSGAAVGVHHQVVGVGDESVALAVVVAHHAFGNPQDDPLVTVLMHSNQSSGVHERLDDGLKRAVGVVVAVGDGTTGGCLLLRPESAGESL